MPKLMVTWLGEDELHSMLMEDRDGKQYEQPVPGPSFNYWGKIRFDKDKPTLIDTDDAKGDVEMRMVLENIIKRAPNMKKRFKTEPVHERSKG